MTYKPKQNVIIRGWKPGFQKIEFTKMLREEFGLGLSEAKSITDDVLGQRDVELFVEHQDFGRLAKRATELGALVLPPDRGTSCP